MKTEDASRFVGTVPENYDRYLVPHIFEGHADELAARAAKLKPTRILELAAGTGIVTRKLRDLIAGECEIIATDLNEPMLEIAKSKFSPSEAVQFERVDATELPYDDDSFDAVVCQFGVMFFPDKSKSYEEVCRVLRPGGSYLFNVWDSLSANSFATVPAKVSSSFFPDDPPGFYEVPFHYHDAAEIDRAVSAAGFDHVSIEHVTLTSAISSAIDFAQGLVFGNPFIEEIVTRGGDPEAIREALAAAIEDELGSSIRLSALLVEASKS